MSNITFQCHCLPDCTIALLAISLLLMTFVFACIVMNNFGRGLANQSAYNPIACICTRSYMYCSGKEARDTARQITRLVPRTHERSSEQDEYRIRAASTDPRTCIHDMYHLAIFLNTPRGHRLRTYLSLLHYLVPQYQAIPPYTFRCAASCGLHQCPTLQTCCCWSSVNEASYLTPRRILSFGQPLHGIYLLHFS